MKKFSKNSLLFTNEEILEKFYFPRLSRVLEHFFSASIVWGVEIIFREDQSFSRIFKKNNQKAYFLGKLVFLFKIQKKKKIFSIFEQVI